MSALLFLLIALVRPLGAVDQEQVQIPSTKSVVHLNRAPVNKEILHVHLPRPVTVKLKNGLTLLILERHRLPNVHIALWVKSGALSDPQGLPGLAQFTAETLREGTAKRSSAQISSEIDTLGAGLGASAEFAEDLTQISASGLSSDLDRLFDLMSDVALHPAFPDSELAKYKIRKLSSLEEERTDSGFLANERLMQEIYPGSPAAVLAPTKDSIQRANSADLKSFHARFYLPNNSFLGISGDVKTDQVVALAQKYFGDWAPHEPEPTSPKITPVTKPFKIDLVDRPGSVQTDIVSGHVAIAYPDADHIPMVIANHILGEGAQARLNVDLRETKGFTYGAYSYLEMSRYPGQWRTSMEVRNAVTGEALRGLLAQLRRLREEKIPSDELENSKRAVIARFALSLESPSSMLDRWLITRYYGLPDNYWDLYPDEAAKINSNTLQRMAERYQDLDHLQLICVGDAKQILDSLKTFGPVDVYNTDGKRIP
jgi:zinc protease